MIKNILIISNSFVNKDKIISGGSQRLLQIFTRIRSNFGKIYIFTNDKGKKWLKKINGIQFILTSKIFDRLILSISYLLRTLQSLEILFIRDIHIIYSSSDFFPNVIPAFLYKTINPDIKWVQCIYHIYPDWRRRQGNKIRNILAQHSQNFSFLLIKKADSIININNNVRKTLLKNGFESNKIFINYPGIDIEYFKQLKVNKKIRKYDGVFLGRLNPSKGIFDLVIIWSLVIKKIPNAKLAIIGGGERNVVDNLKLRIKESKLQDNINLYGYMENDNAFSLIKNSKVFLFTSHEEGFGIAIAEAQACGIPVICWDLSVYKEIFNDSIIKVREYDYKKFTKEYINLFFNKSKREEYTVKGSRIINRYSWDSIALKEKNILNM